MKPTFVPPSALNADATNSGYNLFEVRPSFDRPF